MSILYRMDSGVAGALTRVNSALVVEPVKVTATNTPTVYGIAVKVDANGVHPIGAGAVNADVYGLLVRPFPTQGVLEAGQVADVMKLGYMSVICRGSATPVKGGLVYVRTVTGTDTYIGSFSAAADSTNSFVLVGAHWVGGKDANGNAEIYFNHTV